MKKNLLFLIAVIALVLPSSRAELIVALTSGGQLLTIDSTTPGTVIRTVRVSGLSDTESLVAIDFRPANGGLYALGGSNRLYVIDIASGAAVAVGAADGIVPMGSRFGFDFNPTVDLIRVTSDLDQNLRLNPVTGALAMTDTPLAYATADPNAGQNPTIVGSAYTNSVAGATSTTLYDIDSNLDVLAIQDPPNAGTLHTVGPLGVNSRDSIGFDISPTTGLAYASMTADAPTSPDGVPPPGAQLFIINLSTGAATAIGAIADTVPLGNDTIFDIAVPPPNRLSNISTRGRVGTGNDVLIGGFISSGSTTSRFILRGVGPTLPAALVGTPLADPVLMLFDRNGALVKTNDDWMVQSVASDLTAINASGLAPTNTAEAAIFADLAPGPYTAIVSGKGGATGVALVEIYQLP